MNVCKNFAPILSRTFNRGITNKINYNIRTQSTASSQFDRTTANLEEIEKFGNQSIRWWTVEGDAKGLHSMNCLRVPLIRDGILRTAKNGAKATESSKPLLDVKILDVGCGGGILSEPLARLGATVTGVDASEEMIAVAKDHAKLDETIVSNLDYRCETLEHHLTTNRAKYDAVVASEVVEHVDNLSSFVDTCVKLTKENGSLFFTSINKTPLSWILAIFAAENVFNLLPKGTHSYEKLVHPEELERLLKDGGCRLNIIHGMLYNPLINTWHWIRNTDVNYALHAVKIKSEINN